MLEVSQEDLTTLEPLIKKEGFAQPNIKISIYKNRRGRYKSVLLWCKANRGVCRIEPMFMTNYQYQWVPIEDLKINVQPREQESVF